MEALEAEEGTSSSVIPRNADETDSRTLPKDSTSPPSVPQARPEIWNRIRHGHVSTAMKIRSLLLFISSSLVTFIETISEPKHDKVPPTEIIARIVTSFINGSVEQHQQQRLSHETFLDILLEKIPNSDVRGMHYHEVYLAISPMISSVNWARIKIDRQDAMRSYRSLAGVLHVCIKEVGLANHAEADQLLLAIYVTSVWCSILKQHPELTQPISDYQDFESYMKNWIFHSHFENFSKVFVASCCQIMESSDQMKQSQPKIEPPKPQTPQRGPHIELVRSMSMPATTPEMVHLIPSPCAPSPSQIHPSWILPSPQHNSYMGYPSPGMVHYSPYHPMPPPIDPHQTHPLVMGHAQVKPPTSKPRPAKRKPKNTEELTDSPVKGRTKKGPKPDRGFDDSRDRGESTGYDSSG